VEWETTCCFTGHRPDKLPWGEDEGDPRCLRLKARLRQEVERAYNEGFRHFICGMAQGCDFYFCEAVLGLRDERPGITVEAAIPCEDQASRWSEAQRERWFRLVESCDFETMVQHRYSKGCMLRRDRYMVDRSARLIAAFDGTVGGTLYTISYARKRGIQVVLVGMAEVC